MPADGSLFFLNSEKLIMLARLQKRLGHHINNILDLLMCSAI